jgi:N-acetyl-anhydromuramyl-L-alanine amidase AmpD
MKTKGVLHHTADTTQSPQYDKVWEYHNSGAGGKWPEGFGIQYTYFIERDGMIIQGREEHETTWHAGNWLLNKQSIGICLAGDFTREDPTMAQLKSLKDLLIDIQRRRGIPNDNIYPHREVRATRCPGTDFLRLIEEKLPNKTLKQKIVQLQKGADRSKEHNPSRYRRIMRKLKRLLRLQ